MISASSQTLDVKHHTQKIADFTHISYTISTTYKTPYFYMVNVREKKTPTPHERWSFLMFYLG